MALIKFAPPVKGKRELLCRTDEATVSRIRAPFLKYDGMVERMQPVSIPQKDKVKGIMFNLRFGSGDLGVNYGPVDIMYHLMKFLSLRAAKSKFPENIVNAVELRVFRCHGAAHTAMYSDFVSDDNGVIARRKKAMRRFYGKTSTKEKIQIITAADRCETKMNPKLGPLASKIRKAGYSLCHPEANYHVSDGATIFFEIDRVEIHKVLNNKSLSGIDSDPAAQLVLLMRALAIKECAVRRSHTRNAGLYPGLVDIARLPLQEIYSMVVGLSAASHLDIQRPYDFVRYGLGFWKSTIDLVGRTHDLARPIQVSQIIDPTVVKMLEQQRFANP